MSRRSVQSDAAIIAVAVTILLLLLIGSYFTFFYTIKCNNQQCFIESLRKCSKSSFVNEPDFTTWKYAIKGKENRNIFCVVEVTAQSINSTDEETKSLEGKSMTCSIPLEISGTFFPEDRLEYCHGLFKEGLQEILLKRMNEYVIQNIGEINQSIYGNSSNLA